MNITLSPIQLAVVTASALLAAAIGVLATLRRGHWLVTMLITKKYCTAPLTSVSIYLIRPICMQRE